MANKIINFYQMRFLTLQWFLMWTLVKPTFLHSYTYSLVHFFSSTVKYIYRTILFYFTERWKKRNVPNYFLSRSYRKKLTYRLHSRIVNTSISSGCVNGNYNNPRLSSHGSHLQAYVYIHSYMPQNTVGQEE